MTEPGALPEVIGRCRVQSLLGTGGMGTLYAGHHADLDADVAVKLFPEDLTRDRKVLERYATEARLAASAAGAGVARVHGCGLFDRGYYVIRDYVPGGSLAERIAATGAVPVGEALTVVERLALALGAAHARAGVTHGDLKPANVIVTPDGRIRITELGLSGLVADEVDAAVKGRPSAIVPLETFRYMAPERLGASWKADHRSDIFSVGAILHHMLLGAPPFGGETLQDVVTQVIRQEPKPFTGPEASALQWLLSRTMDKDIRDRFATYDELTAAVKRAGAALGLRPAVSPARGTSVVAPATAEPARASGPGAADGFEIVEEDAFGDLDGLLAGGSPAEAPADGQWSEAVPDGREAGLGHDEHDELDEEEYGPPAGLFGRLGPTAVKAIVAGTVGLGLLAVALAVMHRSAVEDEAARRREAALVARGQDLTYELATVAKEYFELGQKKAPEKFMALFSGEEVRREVVQALIQVPVPGTLEGLQAKLAALDRAFEMGPEVKRANEKPLSETEVYMNRASITYEGRARAVRIFRQKLRDAKGGLVGGVALILFEPEPTH